MRCSRSTAASADSVAGKPLTSGDLTSSLAATASVEPSPDTCTVPANPFNARFSASSSNWAFVLPALGVNTALPSSLPRTSRPSRWSRSPSSPTCTWSCPRLSAKSDSIDQSPARLALFHAPRSILACSPFRPARASVTAISSGEPSRVPLAAMLALGAPGRPRACSSAVTAPGGEPRTERMLFSSRIARERRGRAAQPSGGLQSALQRARDDAEICNIEREAGIERLDHGGEAGRRSGPLRRLRGGYRLHESRSAGRRCAVPLALILHSVPASLSRSTVNVLSDRAPDNPSVTRLPIMAAQLGPPPASMAAASRLSPTSLSRRSIRPFTVASPLECLTRQRRKRGDARQPELEGDVLLTRGDGVCAEREQPVRRRESERPCRLLDPHRRVDLERVSLEERRLGAGYAQSFHHGLQSHVAAGGVEVGMQRRDRASGRQDQPLDLQMGIRRRLGVGAFPVAIERDPLPLEIRPRAHLRRGERVIEIHRAVAQVGATPHLRLQVARAELEIDLLRVMRPRNAEIRGQRPRPGTCRMFSRGPLAGSCAVSVPSMRLGSKRKLRV